MRVQFSLVGHTERVTLWADLDAVPREGEVINLPDISQAASIVRTVVWYPTHDDDGEPLDEPFVYVVVGRPRDKVAADLQARDARVSRKDPPSAS